MIRYRQDISIDMWDNFILNHSDATYFATSKWLDGIISVREWKLQDYSFGVFLDGKLVALVPMQWSVLSKSLMCSGWGWCLPMMSIANEKLEKFVFLKIDSTAKHLKAYHAKLGSFGHVSLNGSMLTQRNLSPAIFHGYVDISPCTQIINLISLSEDNLLKGLSQTARQIVRKAEKDLHVEQVSWKEHLNNYYSMHKFTYAQSDISPHPFRYFEMISELQPYNHKLFAAFDKKGEVVAYHNDLHFRNTAFYHTAASSAEGNRLGAHYLLTWKAIAYARQKGFTAYEMGEIPLNTINQKHINLGFFKTRFGGEPYRMMRLQKSYSWNPRFEALRECVSSAKKFFRSIVGA